MGTPFEVFINASELHFSCAHFLFYATGQREKLHGHNYQLTFRLCGRQVRNDIQCMTYF